MGLTHRYVFQPKTCVRIHLQDSVPLNSMRLIFLSRYALDCTVRRETMHCFCPEQAHKVLIHFNEAQPFATFCYLVSEPTLCLHWPFHFNVPNNAEPGEALLSQGPHSSRVAFLSLSCTVSGNGKNKKGRNKGYMTSTFAEVTSPLCLKKHSCFAWLIIARLKYQKQSRDKVKHYLSLPPREPVDALIATGKWLAD